MGIYRIETTRGARYIIATYNERQHQWQTPFLTQKGYFLAFAGSLESLAMNTAARTWATKSLARRVLREYEEAW